MPVTTNLCQKNGLIKIIWDHSGLLISPVRTMTANSSKLQAKPSPCWEGCHYSSTEAHQCLRQYPPTVSALKKTGSLQHKCNKWSKAEQWGKLWKHIFQSNHNVRVYKALPSEIWFTTSCRLHAIQQIERVQIALLGVKPVQTPFKKNGMLHDRWPCKWNTKTRICWYLDSRSSAFSHLFPRTFVFQ